MNNSRMKTIYKYELKRLAFSYRACAYLVCFIACITLSVAINSFGGGDTRIHPTSALLGIFVLAILPLSTAQTFAGDIQTQKTFLSLGATRCQIYFGKLLAVNTVVILPCVLMLILPPLLAIIGSINYISSYLSVLALMLCIIAITSLLCTVSAVCKEVKTAYISSYALSLILFLTFRACTYLGSTSVLCSVVSIIAPSYSVYSLLSELFEIGQLIKLALLAILGTAFGYTIFKYEIGSKCNTVNSAKLPKSAFALPLGAIAICLSLSLVFSAFPLRADLSVNGITKLSDLAKSELEKIDTDTTLYLVTPKDEPNIRMQKLLERIASENEHITVKELDPEQDRTKILGYTSSLYEASFGSVIVESAKRSVYIPYSEFYYYSEESYIRTLYAYYALESTVPFSQFILENTENLDLFMHDGYRYEEALVQALTYCNSDRINKVCIVGNLPITRELAQYAVQNMTEFTQITLDKADIPSDCDALLYNFGDITDTQLSKLSAYLDGGKKLLTLLDCFDNSSTTLMQAHDYTNINKLFERFGISCDTSVLLDDSASDFSPSTVIADASLGTEALYMPYLNPINVSQDLPLGVSVSTLITTTQNAYAKSDLMSGGLEFDPESDERKAYTVAVKATDPSGACVTLITSGAPLKDLSFFGYDFTNHGNAKTAMFKILGALSGSHSIALNIQPRLAVCPIINGNQTLQTVWCCSGATLIAVLLILRYKRYSKA